MDYFSIFIQMLQTKGLTDNTIRSYKTYMKPYLKYLSSASVLPEDASWQVMRDYLSWIKSERNLSDIKEPLFGLKSFVIVLRDS